MARRSPTAQKALTTKQVTAIRLVCDGYTNRQASQKTGVSEATISKLLRRPDVQAVQLEYCREVLRGAATKAASALVKQLESGNEWIVQNAAAKIIDYANRAEEADDNRTINVNFSVSMPEPGMPEKIEERSSVPVEGEIT